MNIVNIVKHCHDCQAAIVYNIMTSLFKDHCYEKLPALQYYLFESLIPLLFCHIYLTRLNRQLPPDPTCLSICIHTRFQVEVWNSEQLLSLPGKDTKILRSFFYLITVIIPKLLKRHPKMDTEVMGEKGKCKNHLKTCIICICTYQCVYVKFIRASYIIMSL